MYVLRYIYVICEIFKNFKITQLNTVLQSTKMGSKFCQRNGKLCSGLLTGVKNVLSKCYSEWRFYPPPPSGSRTLLGCILNNTGQHTYPKRTVYGHDRVCLFVQLDALPDASSYPHVGQECPWDTTILWTTLVNGHLPEAPLWECGPVVGKDIA